MKQYLDHMQSFSLALAQGVVIRRLSAVELEKADGFKHVHTPKWITCRPLQVVWSFDTVSVTFTMICPMLYSTDEQANTHVTYSEDGFIEAFSAYAKRDATFRQDLGNDIYILCP